MIQKFSTTPAASFFQIKGLLIPTSALTVLVYLCMMSSKQQGHVKLVKNLLNHVNWL